VDLSILAVGRLKGPESELCDRYFDRARKAGKQLGFRSLTVSEIPEARGTRTADRMAAEAQTILAAAHRQPLVCLDEDGDLVGSDAFAQWLRSKADSGAPGVGFVIGGADGLDPSVLSAAERRISFGRCTWPHQLVRVMLAEQLYRAMTILSGHPYHRP
jgi:23S rRNA (pseudouridine1915-N3)-methyltransferase